MASLAENLSSAAQRTIYSTAQLARVAWYTGHYLAGRRLMGPMTKPGEAPHADSSQPLDRARLRSAFRELIAADWRNIERGVYKLPGDMRRPPAPGKLLRQSRDYFRDAARVARRRLANGHSEVLTDAARTEYPRYYLQNFHFQTDGWLSEASAARYDMQVETIFTGAGDAMRRQALPHLRAALDGRDPATARIVDIACGTGAFLKSVKENWPQLSATALDLSPSYLGRARLALADFDDVAFVRAKAEETGLEAGAFDAATCVYLFHELPPAVREAAAAEIARIVKPGGAFILVDTIQYGDEPGFDILLENFPRGVHEPYYDSYCRTDLDALFGAFGLRREDETIAFLTKIVRFRKE